MTDLAGVSSLEETGASIEDCNAVSPYSGLLCHINIPIGASAMLPIQLEVRGFGAVVLKSRVDYAVYELPVFQNKYTFLPSRLSNASAAMVGCVVTAEPRALLPPEASTRRYGISQHASLARFAKLIDFRASALSFELFIPVSEF